MRAQHILFSFKTASHSSCRVHDREAKVTPDNQPAEEREKEREREREREVSMVSREHKRAAALHEKLQLLRSITNSHAVNETSIIVDASKYIGELKEKVERLNQDLTSMQNPACSSQVSFPTVTVDETLEKGFLINVFSEKSCPGLLVFILEAFEELNLTVVEARASCTESFRLQAISTGEGEEQNGEIVDTQVVRQTVLQAIRDWSQSTYQSP